MTFLRAIRFTALFSTVFMAASCNIALAQEFSRLPTTQSTECVSESIEQCAFLRYRAGDYQGAIVLYNQAIANNPNNPIAYNNRGVAKSKLADYSGAIEDYTRAVSLDGSYAQAYHNRATAKKIIQLDAYEDLVRAAQLDPTLYAMPEPRKIVTAAVANEIRPQSDRASIAQPAVELLPADDSIPCEDHVSWTQCGIKRQRLGDHKGAIAAYTQAIQSNPNDAVAYNNRGVAADKLNDMAAAITDYTQAIIIKPDYSEAYFNRATAKRRLNQPSESDFARAYALMPAAEPAPAVVPSATPRIDALENSPPTRAESPNQTSAIDEFLAQESPEDEFVQRQCAADSLVQCGVSRYQAGDYRGALATFDQEIAQNPDNAVAYNNRGVTKEKLLNYEGALQDYNKALALNPYYMEARSNLAAAQQLVLEIKQIGPR